ncbi:MAG: ATP-binding protein [Polyangiaceae bacterium]|nr:ATP-binding protein [Polyangiaceae bacterium]
MSDYEKLGFFYLGARDDGEPVLLPSADLTTHAVCVGMTGSGKTGLGVALLEEAAIDGVPVLAIDPKGDLANLALQPEGLDVEHFATWVDPDAARRQGLTVPAFAEQERLRVERGLLASGQPVDRISRLRAAAEVVVYTPGSEAGVPLSVLGSLGAPSIEIRSSPEALRARVQTTASALLGLAGVDADPVQSREHVLVSTLLEQAWAAGGGFDLAGLVRGVQTPPFASIGVLDLESFYPRAERFSLVMALNNLLASPSAAALTRGAPLDVGALLYAPDGRPRVAVLTISHLDDEARRAFVTMLLGNVLAWMRAQPGTSGLRALLFMDEVAGYLPPVANPPTKPLFLTLFKQARAFGLGVVVATQNPVDVDYKVLSNAGTWLVGRLQTARDRAKVMEGLRAAAEAAGGALAEDAYDAAIASLASREFLLGSARGGPPFKFTSRFCLSYLRGPLSLAEIARLPRPVAQARSGTHELASGPSRSPPVVSPEIVQLYAPLATPAASTVGYLPAVLGVARVRHVDRKLKVDLSTSVCLAATVEPSVVGVDWQKAYPLPRVAPEALASTPASPAVWQAVPPAALDPARYPAWRRALVEHLLRAYSVELFTCEAAGLVSTPGEDERAFRIRLAEALRVARDLAAEKVRDKVAARARAAAEKVRRAEERLAKEGEEASASTMSAVVGVGAGVLGALLGSRVVSQANARRAAGAARGVGRARTQKQDVERARRDLDAARAALSEVEAEVHARLAAIAAAHDPSRVTLERAVVTPKKAHVEIVAVGLGWLPYLADATGVFHPAWPG